MELKSEQTLPVDRDTAWEALNDVELLRQSIPGCESLTVAGEGAYELVVLAAVGPVKARFKGRLQIEEPDPPQSYTIRFDGQGGAAGFGKGHARVELEPDGQTRTLLRYAASAQVGGKIAQIGSRLVDMAARKMAGQFFDNFGAALQARHPAEATDALTAGSDVPSSPPAPSVGDAPADADTAPDESKSWLDRLRGR